MTTQKLDDLVEETIRFLHKRASDMFYVSVMIGTLEMSPEDEQQLMEALEKDVFIDEDGEMLLRKYSNIIDESHYDPFKI